MSDIVDERHQGNSESYTGRILRVAYSLRLRATKASDLKFLSIFQSATCTMPADGYQYHCCWQSQNFGHDNFLIAVLACRLSRDIDHRAHNNGFSSEAVSRLLERRSVVTMFTYCDTLSKAIMDERWTSLRRTSSHLKHFCLRHNERNNRSSGEHETVIVSKIRICKCSAAGTFFGNYTDYIHYA
jgi:hypothetical protein